MFDWSLPLWGDVAVLVGAALTIGAAGVKSAGYADRVADRTGLGEAVTGTVFLGLLTALPGLAASVTAAMKGDAALAIANAMGGIAVQTVALAIADVTYRRANLEHAAASAANMMQCVILVMLLTLPLFGLAGPEVTIGHVHPVSILLFVAAGFGFWLVLRTRAEPMWRPRETDETVIDEPAEGSGQESMVKLVLALLASAGLTALAGAAVAEATENVVEATGMGVAVAGGLLMAGATSLPELVTSIAAVRRGALTLAVSDIVGGNFFDVLFVAAADLVYLQGSIYHGDDVGRREIFLVALTVLLNVVLLMGLIHRQKRGPGNIGFESVLMLVLYVVGFLVMALAM